MNKEMAYVTTLHYNSKCVCVCVVSVSNRDVEQKTMWCSGVGVLRPSILADHRSQVVD